MACHGDEPEKIKRSLICVPVNQFAGEIFEGSLNPGQGTKVISIFLVLGGGRLGVFPRSQINLLMKRPHGFANGLIMEHLYECSAN